MKTLLTVLLLAVMFTAFDGTTDKSYVEKICLAQDAWIGTWEVTHIDGETLSAYLQREVGINPHTPKHWSFTFYPDKSWRSTISVQTEHKGNLHINTFFYLGEYSVSDNEYQLTITKYAKYTGGNNKIDRAHIRIRTLLKTSRKANWYPRLNNPCLGLNIFAGFTVSQK